MKRYFPVLLSKAGELTALSNLTQNVKNEIAPVIQVLTDGFDRVEEFASANWAFANNQLFLDFSLCDTFDSVATRVLIKNLTRAGVNVTPVLQNNSNPSYITLLQTLIGKSIVLNVCMRFSNGNYGLININAQIATILGKLTINRNQTSILLDFGLVENYNYPIISAYVIDIITDINYKTDYKNIIVASSSFLEKFNNLTPVGRLYRLHRYEWDIWQTLIAHSGFAGIVKYGDYGTKYPFYSEANFQGICSIRYTLPTEFLVYKGDITRNNTQGNEQYITFADSLVGSADYSGAAFSWGDNKIDYYAGQVLVNLKRKPGNALIWQEISQTHHITLLHSLL